jgi:hypothetical protein
MAGNIFVGFEFLVRFSTSQGSGTWTYDETTPVARGDWVVGTFHGLRVVLAGSWRCGDAGVQQLLVSTKEAVTNWWKEAGL